MINPQPSKPGSIPETLEDQILQALDRPVAAERQAAIEALCETHPEHAAEIRAWDSAAGQEPEPEDPNVRKIGPYRLLEKLGSGGMGDVWLAERRSRVRQRVALKLIKRGMDTEQVIARFEAESQALARMNHPHIARILDAGETDDGLPFFVMEYVAGLPLTRYCDEHRLTVVERLGVFLQVCQGVQHAHHRGILHRDLKPANILVTIQDGNVTPKIIDFGLARAMDRGLTTRTLHTQIGSVLGTPDYMSPEQLGPRGIDVDARTDVYSLGIVLYELLVGSRPFSSDQLAPDELPRHIREEGATRPSEQLTTSDSSLDQAGLRRTSVRVLQRSLRTDLDWIVMCAIEREPGSRYQTASELARDIERYLEGEPLEAGPPSALYRITKWARKHRGRFVAAGTAVGALIAGMVVSLVFWLKAEAASQQDQMRAHSLKLAVQQLQSVTQRLQGMSLDLLQKLDAARATVTSGGEVPDALISEIEAAMLEGFGQRTVDARRRARELYGIDDSMPEPLQELWKEAISAIKNADGVTASGLYAGIQLTPQPDLIPLGMDPETKLWEFYHPASGKISAPLPGRSREPRIGMNGDRGLVFVLIPGGKYRIGGQGHELAYEDEHDFEVELEPFMVSKFELTRGQWQRMIGQAVNDLLVADDGHPALAIPWVSAVIVMLSHGMLLPTEAQWEVAARGGDVQPWPTLSDVEQLRLAANLSDAAAKKRIDDLEGASEDDFESWNDGFPFSAPVGSLAPNGYGLYDTLGNVAEWCLDPYHAEAAPPPRARDGYRGENQRMETGARFVSSRSCRGGSFAHLADEARVSYRNSYQAHLSGYIGVRPVKPLQ